MLNDTELLPNDAWVYAQWHVSPPHDTWFYAQWHGVFCTMTRGYILNDTEFSTQWHVVIYSMSFFPMTHMVLCSMTRSFPPMTRDSMYKWLVHVDKIVMLTTSHSSRLWHKGRTAYTGRVLHWVKLNIRCYLVMCCFYGRWDNRQTFHGLWSSRRLLLLLLQFMFHLLCD